MTLLVGAPEGREAERRYVLDVVLGDWLGLEYELGAAADGWSIRMAGDVANRAIALPDIFFATPERDWLATSSLPRRPLARVPAAGVEQLPVLFGDSVAGAPAWRPEPGGGRLSIDVFGSVFFLLSRYEEAVPGGRDAHGRFTAAQSIAGAEGFVDRPIADAYVDLLWSALAATWAGLTRRASTFRLRLTHDVDRPWATMGRPLRAVLPGMGADLVRRRAPLLALQRGRAALDARRGRYDRDPYDTYDFLMATSERHGLRSTFYFLAGNEPADGDFRYRLTEAPFRPLLRRIHERGHEIGLHASYGSYRSADRIRLELAALQAACHAAGVDQPGWGVRQHYLRFECPTTWRNHEEAGLEHDSTVGFHDQVGFRAGTCREYQVFDLAARRQLAVRERPLVVMDGTLFEYLDLGLHAAEARVAAVVDACRRHAGDAVLLYHNSSLPGAHLQRHYARLVASLAGDGA